MKLMGFSPGGTSGAFMRWLLEDLFEFDGGRRCAAFFVQNGPLIHSDAQFFFGENDTLHPQFPPYPLKAILLNEVSHNGTTMSYEAS